jgi:hypothetical protein
MPPKKQKRKRVAKRRRVIRRKGKGIFSDDPKPIIIQQPEKPLISNFHKYVTLPLVAASVGSALIDRFGKGLRKRRGGFRGMYYYPGSEPTPFFTP